MTYRATYLRRHYRRWPSRYGRGTLPRPVLIGVAAGVALAAAGGNAATHHHGHQLPAITAAGSYTPASWAAAFLAGIPEPRTACNRAAILAWENAEGGHWHNSAAYNPLDTTMAAAGSSSMNSVGVQAYTSWAQGLAATVATIRNGNFPGILATLAAGDDAQAVADAVAQSPWGTQAFTAEC